ncbi:MAG: purine-nucleoside phosphorylase [bacterium]|nr:purine-nucleoside phosphorylase [bacterium]
MEDLKKAINKTVDAIRKETKMKPEIGIILGTGLGKLAGSIKVETSIPYGKIPDFPISTVESHKGRLLFGTLGGKKVVAMQGRFHYYEGYSMQEVTFPVRVLKALGCKIMVVSNAAGGINPLFNRGDVMLISDHINFFPEHPLRGKNDDSIGPRFPDMLNIYDRDLLALAEKVALEQRIPVRKGVYLGLQGPCFETSAEYRMIKILGADAVGMSTVPEVIVARHCGLKVIGMSIITDMGLPDILEPVSAAVVIKAANEAEPKLAKLVEAIIKEV